MLQYTEISDAWSTHQPERSPGFLGRLTDAVPFVPSEFHEISGVAAARPGSAFRNPQSLVKGPLALEISSRHLQTRRQFAAPGAQILDEPGELLGQSRMSKNLEYWSAQDRQILK